MKLFVLALLFVAGVSSSPTVFRTDEAENYGDENGNYGNNIDSLSSRKHHAVLIPGLGIVNTHSPLWAALKGMTEEEQATFIEQLKEIKQKKEELVDDKSTARQDTTTLNDENNAEENSEELYRKTIITYISGLGFVKEGSDLWKIVKSMNSEQIIAFVEESTAMYDQKYLEDLGLVKQKDVFSRTAHAVFVSGLGFVNTHSPLWAALTVLTEEERATFIEQLKLTKQENELAINIASASSRRDDMAVQEQLDIEDAFSRKKHVVFVPDFGFVNTHSPLWSVLKEMAEEERATFIEQLKERKQENELAINIASASSKREDTVQEELDIEETNEVLSRKTITWISGLGFLKEGSDLWNIVKNMNSEQVAAFVEEATAKYGPKYLQDMGMIKQKYTTADATAAAI